MFGQRSNSGSTTIIGRGARFTGTLELEGDVHIEGQCDGTIRAKAQLSVGRNGSVTGELSAGVVIIAGRVEGTAIANETLHVLPNGSLKGDAFYGRLQVDSGGVVDGRTHQGPPPPMLTASVASETSHQRNDSLHDESSVFDASPRVNGAPPLASEEAPLNAAGGR
jgi:cytoskeletal protein CcmA (bactofilin family)